MLCESVSDEGFATVLQAFSRQLVDASVVLFFLPPAKNENNKTDLIVYSIAGAHSYSLPVAFHQIIC